MAKRKVHITILHEDRQHKAFISRLLKGLGFQPRTFRFNPPAASENDAYVLREYAKEVRELRRLPAASRWLLVILDVDNRDFDERRKQLDDQLRDDSQDVRKEDDQIVLLLPRRNIETWIAWLEGSEVNETDDYGKHRGEESACAPAVKKLVEIVRSGEKPPNGCPSSLAAAIKEMRRFVRRK